MKARYFVKNNTYCDDITNQVIGMRLEEMGLLPLIEQSSIYDSNNDRYIIDSNKFREILKVHFKNSKQKEGFPIESMNSTKNDTYESAATESLNTAEENTLKTELNFTPVESKKDIQPKEQTTINTNCKNIQSEVISKLQFISQHTNKNWIQKTIDLYDPITQSMTRFYFAVENEKAKTFDQLLKTTELTDSIQTLVHRNKAVLIGSTTVKIPTSKKQKDSFIKNLNIYLGSIKKSILKRFNKDQKESFCKEENCFVLDRKVRFEETITIHSLKRALEQKEVYGTINLKKFYKNVSNNINDTVMEIQLKEKVLTKKQHIA